MMRRSFILIKNPISNISNSQAQSFIKILGQQISSILTNKPRATNTYGYQIDKISRLKNQRHLKQVSCFSTLKHVNQSETQKDLNLNETKDQNLSNASNMEKENKSNQQQSSSAAELIRIFLENKRRIQILNNQISSTHNNKSHNRQQTQNSNIFCNKIKFDLAYLQELLSKRYYYADIVNVANFVINDLIAQLQTKTQVMARSSQLKEDQENAQQPVQQNRQKPSGKQFSTVENNGSAIEAVQIHRTQLQFLLYVYHLYPHQFLPMRQRLITLLTYFLRSQIHNKQSFLSTAISQETKNRNKQFLYFLRKFIQNEMHHHKSCPQPIELKICYLNWLKYSYEIEKNKCNQGQNNKVLLKQMQTLHQHLVMFTHLWVSSGTVNNNKHYKSQNLKIPNRQVVAVFQYFVNEIESIMAQVNNLRRSKESSSNNNNPNNHIGNQNDNKINQDTNHNANQKQNPSTSTTYKQLIQTQFTQLQLKPILNQIILIFHRSNTIFNPPKSFHFNKTQNIDTKRGRSNRNQDSITYQKEQNEFQNFTSYFTKKLNILTYLDTSQRKSQLQFLQHLYFIRKLCTYHTIRKIPYQQLTHFLSQLLENNSHLINDTTNRQLRAEIKQMIGDLVSTLVSSFWVDKDDLLNKFLMDQFILETKKNISRLNEGRRNNKGEWYQIKSQ